MHENCLRNEGGSWNLSIYCLTRKRWENDKLEPMFNYNYL